MLMRVILLAVVAGAFCAREASAVLANDLPTAAEVLGDCNAVVEGTTVGAANDVQEMNCPNASIPDGYFVYPYGGDVFYRVSLPASFRATVLVEPVGDWDVSIYSFTTPSNPAETCWAAADIDGPGGAELIIIENGFPSGNPVDFIIAVDSWRADSFGDFVLSVTCDAAVAVEPSGFSTLKSRFTGGR